MRWLSRLGIAVALTLGFVSLAGADDLASLRQEVDSLRGKIERIDADIGDTNRGSTELKDESAAYAAKVQTSAAAGQGLKQRGQQLTDRMAQLETEHASVEQLCQKTTATTAEYQAALAQCETSRQSYQQHADAYRAEQQRLAADYAAFEAANKDLQAQYKDIEQKRQDVLARQASLHVTREETLNRFNEVRDRLMALQSGAK